MILTTLINNSEIDERLIIPIQQLDIPEAIKDSFIEYNIYYVGDLATKSASYLQKIPGIGRGKIKKIRTLLKVMGLELNMEVPYWPISHLAAEEQCRYLRLLNYKLRFW